MRYLAVLLPLAAASPVTQLNCAQIPVTVPEQPRCAVNFTRERNACYISGMLQSVIALKPWREYVLSYPPHNTCTYNTELLAALQTLVKDYINQSNSNALQVNLQPFYKVISSKKTTYNQPLVPLKEDNTPAFSDSNSFLTNLSRLLAKNYYCSLFQPFLFSMTVTVIKNNIREEPHEHIAPNGAIQLYAKKPFTSGKPFLDQLDSYFNARIPDYGMREYRFTSLPSALWIQFYQDSIKWGEEDYSIPIPPHLDLAKFCEDPSRIPFTSYTLKSVLWRTELHFIVYVNYNGTWYLCDDTETACSIPQNPLKDLQHGSIWDSTWGICYPLICLYEQIPTSSASSSALSTLHASLQLLAT